MPAIAAVLWVLAAGAVLFLVGRARRTGKDVDRFRSQWADYVFAGRVGSFELYRRR